MLEAHSQAEVSRGFIRRLQWSFQGTPSFAPSERSLGGKQFELAPVLGFVLRCAAWPGDSGAELKTQLCQACSLAFRAVALGPSPGKLTVSVVSQGREAQLRPGSPW